MAKRGGQVPGSDTTGGTAWRQSRPLLFARLVLLVQCLQIVCRFSISLEDDGASIYIDCAVLFREYLLVGNIVEIIGDNNY